MFQSRRERAVEHQLCDALGMLHRVCDRDRAATRDPKQRKSIEPGRVNDRFEIADPRIEADIGHVPLGHAIATLVVADEPMMK
jgi:hypothetical protein